MVTAGAGQALVEAVETVRRRVARARAWAVGEAELDVDFDVQKVGTQWPL
jgi:hypothetical protein